LLFQWLVELVKGFAILCFATQQRGRVMSITIDDKRWQGIQRDYDEATVARLRGSVRIRHTLAERGAARLWDQLQTAPFVPSLGAFTGNQAIQMVKAGL
jgi:isocitrate lyase